MNFNRLIIFWLLGALFLASLAVFIFLTGTLSGIFSTDDASINLEKRLVSLGTWVQTTISIMTLIIAGTAITQLSLMRQQMANDETRKQQEAYRRLIDPQVVTIKRYVRSELVQNAFAEVDGLLKESEVGAAKAKVMLEKLRERIYLDVSDNCYPLFLGKAISLDHIEHLLNEYNSLSKLLNEKQLMPGFSTELGLKNFENIYQATRPFIELRRKIDAAYAREFVRFTHQGDHV